jgi:hypothetical protein
MASPASRPGPVSFGFFERAYLYLTAAILNPELLYPAALPEQQLKELVEECFFTSDRAAGTALLRRLLATRRIDTTYCLGKGKSLLRHAADHGLSELELSLAAKF